MKTKFQNEIRGLYFNNGIQAIAKIVDEDEHFLYVENLLGLQLTMGNDGNSSPMVHLEDFTPFAVIEKEGLTTRIPQSSVMIVFPVEERLLAGYKKRTSRIVTFS